MALSNTYVQVYGQLPQLFQKITEGQAPPKFGVQHLKDLGFTSSSHRGFLPLLKAIGFLSDDGTPTQRYHEYRNHAQSKRVMADALREAYGDLFVIKAKPSESDRPAVEGKFKSVHNTSDRPAQLMANTFFALLALADLDSSSPQATPIPVPSLSQPPVEPDGQPPVASPSLHYDIQIHLPATKDIEVFNAIFKSLREHLLG